MKEDSERSTDTPSTYRSPEAATAWLSSAPERQNATGSPGSTTATSRTGPTAQAAHVQALAARLGRDAEEMAARIPEDTLRRLKNPVVAIDNGDGTTSYNRPSGIITDGRTPALGVDRGTTGVTPAPTRPRDAGGKFTSSP